MRATPVTVSDDLYQRTAVGKWSIRSLSLMVNVGSASSVLFLDREIDSQPTFRLGLVVHSKSVLILILLD